jgi:hypothetical protein
MTEEELEIVEEPSGGLDVVNPSTDVNLEVMEKGLKVSIGPVSLILDSGLIDAICATKTIKIEKSNKEVE